MWSMSDYSTEICERVIQTGFHVDMLKNLTWYTLSVDDLNRIQSASKSKFVEAHIGTLHNVVRRVETARSAFRQCQAVDVLHKFRDVQNPVTFYILFLYVHVLFSLPHGILQLHFVSRISPRRRLLQTRIHQEMR